MGEGGRGGREAHDWVAWQVQRAKTFLRVSFCTAYLTPSASGGARRDVIFISRKPAIAVCAKGILACLNSKVRLARKLALSAALIEGGYLGVTSAKVSVVGAVLETAKVGPARRRRCLGWW